jgi:hypothetical protein
MPRRRRRRLRLRRPKPWAIAAAAVIVAFAGALWTWAGSSIGDDLSDIKGLDTLPGAAALANPGASPSGSGAAPGSGGVSSAPPGGLPSLSLSTGPTTGGRHVVSLTVRSDSTLAAVRYSLAGAAPVNRTMRSVPAPFVLTAEAAGSGLITALGAQAGPGASSMTVTVAVDGRIVCTRSTTGPFATAVCYG